jgi:alanine racemase
MAVVKADAYGHGLGADRARAAVEAGIGWLGVLDIETGLELRENGILAMWRCSPLLAPHEDYAARSMPNWISRVPRSASLMRLLQLAHHPRSNTQFDTGLHRNGAEYRGLAGSGMMTPRASDSVEPVGVDAHRGGVGRP